MRLRSLFMPLAAAGLLLVTGGPTSLAQAPQQRSLFQLFWQQPAAPAVAPQRARPAPPVVRRRPEPAIIRDDPVIPKVDVAHHVLVIGDSLGVLVAKGLGDALNDRPDVAVVNRAKPDSGLVRTDFFDWPKTAAEILAGDPKVVAGIMLLGLNDRQAIREGEVMHEPLSPRWLELYRARIDAVAAAFTARGVPLIWVSAPPVQNSRLSADFIAFNEQYRQQVEKAGGHYVDLWGGFVDAENRYTAMGPDVAGQTARLRLGDGIHFTAAGARKAAHFIDLVLRRLLDAQPRSGVIALPPGTSPAEPASAELPPGSIESLIDRMVSGLPTIALPPALQAKPAAGPIMPLTGMTPGGDQTLLVSIREARGNGEIAAELDRVFGEGRLPEPKPGRLDDYRWPR